MSEELYVSKNIDITKKPRPPWTVPLSEWSHMAEETAPGQVTYTLENPSDSNQKFWAYAFREAEGVTEDGKPRSGVRWRYADTPMSPYLSLEDQEAAFAERRKTDKKVNRLAARKNDAGTVRPADAGPTGQTPASREAEAGGGRSDESGPGENPLSLFGAEVRAKAGIAKAGVGKADIEAPGRTRPTGGAFQSRVPVGEDLPGLDFGPCGP